MNCFTCGAQLNKSPSATNRAQREGRPLFCNKVCFGLSRRVERSAEQKKEEKRLYDIAYRDKNLKAIKAKKAAAFQRDYDPVKAAVHRKENMHKHIEYCRRPEYRKWKAEYDQKYLAKKEFGEFWEAAIAVYKIEAEVDSRMTRYEVYQSNGTINKTQKRKRDYERLISNES
jgi:hypothetical protein